MTNPVHILVVENKKVLGVSKFKMYEMDIYPDKEFWLGNLFVSPASRRRVVGSALANKIATTAESFGVKELHL